MDFFAHQEAARKRTGLLLFYYGLAVVALIVATYAAAMIIFGLSSAKMGVERPSWWRPDVFGITTLGTLMVITLGSLWQTLALRQGGSAVAQMLGGELIDTEPTDPHERKLRNVVEEMAIASGVPMPQLFVMREERGINAFAAGYSTADAAIGVTRGCIEKLNRDELQGVIAHEFSHILNGDMRLNIRLIAVLHGILCLYIIGRILLRVRASSSGSRKKGGNPLPLFGLALIVIGGLGILFGRLIQAAVSRQREFLADASAVQFTRHPQGIAGALKKMGGVGSKLQSPQAGVASHLFFGNGLGEAWFGLMATHPPLAERIKRIEPAFDGTFSEVQVSAPEFMDEFALKTPVGLMPLAEIRPPPLQRADRIVQHIGDTVQVSYAAGLLDALPSDLRAAAHQPLPATALMFGLLLSRSTDVRERQLSYIRAADITVAHEVARYSDALAALDPRARLPLLSLCLPSLRTLSREQWQRFRAVLEQLVCCDAQIDLFEFVLRRVIERNIDAQWQPKQAGVVQFYSFTPLANDCAVLLSALAHVGAADATAARNAFGQGAASLPPNLPLPFFPAEQCGVEHIDAALTRLVQAVPHIKRTVLEACARAVSCDGNVNASEGELLRAVAESLDCPVPPFVEGV